MFTEKKCVVDVKINWAGIKQLSSEPSVIISLMGDLVILCQQQKLRYTSVMNILPQVSIGVRAIFLPGGAVNHLPKTFLQVDQIFTKQSNRNEGRCNNIGRTGIWKWLHTVFQGQYLPNLSINYVAPPACTPMFVFCWQFLLCYILSISKTKIFSSLHLKLVLYQILAASTHFCLCP